MRVQHNTGAEGELTGAWYSPRPAAARPRWPDAVAYREAIQNPHGALADARLKGSEVVSDRRGLPVAYSGRFAIVFRLKDADGSHWALRCFTSPPANAADRHRRYEFVSRHADELKDAFVPYRFIDRGICVAGEWFPVVAMRWAKGETLGRFVERNLHDPEKLRTLCGTLSALLQRLEEAGVAHGDWQHDNLIVANGGRTVTLVDYDGMFVPELAGERGEEIGHPNYQHPARVPEHFGPGLDRFPCLVMQTALLALAHDPSLWSRFSDGESLLFKKTDFADPESSPLFHGLRETALRRGDEALADSIARLEDACTHGPESTLLPAIEPTALLPQSFEERRDPVATAGMASRAKWWVEAQPGGVGGTTLSTPRPRPATAAFPATAGLAAATHGYAYLGRLQQAEVLEQEATHLLRARAGLAATFAFAILLIVSLTQGSQFFPFYLFFWVFNLAGLTYHSWPRKRVHDEICQEIEKMEKQVETRRKSIQERRQLMGTVASLPGTASLQDYINDKLQAMPINAVLRINAVNGPRAETLRQLKAAGVTTVYHLQGRTSVPGVPSHVMDALRSWIDELRMEFAAEFRTLTLPSQSVPGDIARLEQEMHEFERVRDRLSRERDQFPDISFAGYLRRVLGQSEAPPPTANP
ncbi:MAG TPA: hypothetical protein VM490_06495 [Armatimonadaceae bacterium]|nr:hypothetical protein [Armatimonadaceae bacterium]